MSAGNTHTAITERIEVRGEIAAALKHAIDHARSALHATLKLRRLQEDHSFHQDAAETDATYNDVETVIEHLMDARERSSGL